MCVTITPSQVLFPSTTPSNNSNQQSDNGACLGTSMKTLVLPMSPSFVDGIISSANVQARHLAFCTFVYFTPEHGH